MSWLFGRKKPQKESPPESSTEEEQQDPNDGYIFVERKVRRPAPPPPSEEGTPYPSSGLYPGLDGAGNFRVNPTTSGDEESNQDPPHYLSGVPFKLCKQLEREIVDDLEIDRLQIGEILAFIKRLNSRNNEYPFELEQSVITEMNSTTTDQ